MSETHSAARRAIDAEDVRVVLAVGAEQDRDDLGVEEIALREERAQRPIRHAAGEDFLFGGAAFALEVAAGELARGRRLFLVFDGEREPVLPLLELGGGNGGDEDDGLAAGDGDGAVREFSHPSGFEVEGCRANLARDGMYIHWFSFLLVS